MFANAPMKEAMAAARYGLVRDHMITRGFGVFIDHLSTRHYGVPKAWNTLFTWVAIYAVVSILLETSG